MERETIRRYLLLTTLFRLGISFISATYVVFLTSKGLNLFEVNLVNFVFFATLFLFEIPTGAVADVFGRKISFVCACFLLSCSMLTYAASKSFWQFALAEAIGAVGATFASGAFQAWLVDKLRHHGFTGALAPVFAKEQQLTHASGIAGALAGAFVADRNIALPWIMGGCVFFLTGVLAALLMKEEYFVRRSFSARAGLSSMKETAQASVRYGVRNKAIRFILAIGTAQFFAVQAPNMQWQLFFIQFLPNKTSLGFVFAGIALAMMLGAFLAPRLLQKAKSEKHALALTQLAVGGGISLTVVFRWLPPALAVFLAHEVARGMFKPLKDAYLHDNIPSKERATIVSFESITHHTGGMAGLLVSGFIAEYASIPTAWLVSGGALIVSAVLFLKNGRKK